MLTLLITKTPLLFIFSSPQEWLLVIVAGFLLFGANRLPELAKSIGQTRKAFKQGMLEAEDEERAESREKPTVSPAETPSITQIDDAALLKEIRRRKERANQLKAGEP